MKKLPQTPRSEWLSILWYVRLAVVTSFAITVYICTPIHHTMPGKIAILTALVSMTCLAPIVFAYALKHKYLPAAIVAAYPLIGFSAIVLGVLASNVMPGLLNRILPILVPLAIIYFGPGTFITLVFMCVANYELPLRLRQRDLITIGCHGTTHDTVPPQIGEAAL